MTRILPEYTYHCNHGRRHCYGPYTLDALMDYGRYNSLAITLLYIVYKNTWIMS